MKTHQHQRELKEDNANMYNNNDNNDNSNIKLKINPKYEVQIRPLTPCEYKMLRNSIQIVGQRVPIIADKDGNIIDGHHRFKICMRVGN